MKRSIKFFLAACVAMLGVACSDGGNDDPTPTPPPSADANSWHLVSWAPASEFNKEIYLQFEGEQTGTFTLYQDITDHGYTKYTGTFTYDAVLSQLSGTYSDGVAWTHTYIVSGQAQVSLMLSAVDAPEDISTFEWTKLPDLVETGVASASVEDAGYRFL